jgi:diguanylate cyclase (GGDEF)-like protein
MANRLQLETHLAGVLDQARATRTGVGVIFLDLDNFKNVNDNWGHQTGDELLQVIATRLQSSLRPGELAARVGGDEFIVVCAGLRTNADAAKIADRVLRVLDEAVRLPNCEIAVSASAGLAFARPALFDVTASDLLREADTAMYRSKGDGRHAPVLFDESMRIEVAERVELESALRGALERGELALHYQPIVDLRTGDPRGFEALMRWHHPVLGSVAPDRFIPIAEDTGLILKLGRWAIVEATTQLQGWRAATGLDLSMSVNLSAHQMHDPGLVATVRGASRARASRRRRCAWRSPSAR